MVKTQKNISAKKDGQLTGRQYYKHSYNHVSKKARHSANKKTRLSFLKWYRFLWKMGLLKQCFSLRRK